MLDQGGEMSCGANYAVRVFKVSMDSGVVNFQHKQYTLFWGVGGWEGIV